MVIFIASSIESINNILTERTNKNRNNVKLEKLFVPSIEISLVIEDIKLEIEEKKRIINKIENSIDLLKAMPAEPFESPNIYIENDRIRNSKTRKENNSLNSKKRFVPPVIPFMGDLKSKYISGIFDIKNVDIPDKIKSLTAERKELIKQIESLQEELENVQNYINNK